MTAPDATEQLRTALGDRCHIERELGRGGMAIVYLARDLRHDRLVALKVLRPDPSAVLGPERFAREIKLAAGLQHPHIVSVYDSGATPAGQLWFTMPFVDGESLRDRLRRERQLPLEDTLAIVREIADALAYAHAHGVIHRDVKPENVLLANGHALLTDFGIARPAQGMAGPRSPETGLTQTGFALGTPAYMSPEQASGERTIDGRTDIYSLGAVLYEMLTGETPFLAATPQAMVAKMMANAPPALRTLRRDVPPSIDAAVQKALAPVPAARYATAAAFGNALEPSGRSSHSAVPRYRTRAIVASVGLVLATSAVGIMAWRGRAQASGHVIGIAVLPFDNLGDTTDAYFADGVTDAVRGKLAALSQLQVTASTSSGQFRRTTKSLQLVARELGVRYLLVGRVRWARTAGDPGRVQVSPELIDASTATDKWQQAFDAPLTDVFQVQAEIATRVVQALQIVLTPAAQQAINQRPTSNLDAYDAYVRARGKSNLGGGASSSRAAIALYSRAIALDSTFALAYAGLGGVEAALYENGFDRDSVLLAAAKAAADHALQLRPNAAEGLLALGNYYEAAGNLPAAGEQYRAAYRAEPSFANAFYQAGETESFAGRLEAGLEDYRRAVALDPAVADYHSRVGEVYLLLHRYEESEQELSRALALAPEQTNPYEDLAMWLVLMRGDTTGARRLYDSALVRCGRQRMAGLLEEADWLWLPVRWPGGLESVDVGEFGGDTAGYYYTRAGFYRSRGLSDKGHAYADSARMRLERMVAHDRVPEIVHEKLALVFEYLGRYQDAAREVDAAAAANPSYPGSPSFVRYLRAYVDAGSGNVPAALDELRHELDSPSSWVSRAWLRVDPNWDFLRGDARFQQLIAPAS